MDFATARQNMVNCQLRTNKITDDRILDAMRTIPRELFVPKQRQTLAYIDEDLEIGDGRYLMEPQVLGRMIQTADIQADDSVLVVGAATGYAAAVASRLAQSVFALEENEAMAKQGETLLTGMAMDNVVFVNGPLKDGWKKDAPFNVVIFDGAIEELPKGYTDQLAEGGRLVAVIGSPGKVGRVHVFGKRNGTVSSRTVFDAYIQPLPGFEKEQGFVF